MVTRGLIVSNVVDMGPNVGFRPLALKRNENMVPMSSHDNTNTPDAKMIAVSQAAEQGNADAQFLLGLLKEDGDGCAADPVEAVRWHNLAADQNHAGAQYRLAQMKEFGVGCEIDLTEAFKWYRRAALQDYPDAREDLFALCRAHPDLQLPVSELLDGQGRS
jgi:TPR repeat protein